MLKLNIELLAPEFLLEEFKKHSKLILEKTNRSQTEFDDLINIFKDKIIFAPYSFFSDCLNLANKISPDPNDSAYFALALKLNCSIWSNDKRLKNQDEIKIYSTQDLIGLL
jgi:predicted nucleic acid-binding protein